MSVHSLIIRPVIFYFIVLALVSLANCRRFSPTVIADDSKSYNVIEKRDKANTPPRPAVLTLPPQNLSLKIPAASHQALQEQPFYTLRQEMVDTQIRSRHLSSPRVLAAMQWVPRHMFVPPDIKKLSYMDEPQEIGHDQTISQPYIVALMTDLLQVKPSDKVLEIGTGSGYQAAILSVLAKEVFTIEIISSLSQQAQGVLQKLGYHNVFVRAGDGYLGWPEKAPFDKIIITAAPPKIPDPLLRQLKTAGRMVLPLGNMMQQHLIVINKTLVGTFTRKIIPVAFVPMVGEIQKK